jgi:hypothetical protein
MGETESEAGQSKPKLYSSASPKCSAELVSAIVAYIDTRRDRDMLEPNASEDQSESDRNDQLYRQLKQALMEVEESKREAYEECVRRFKAENTAVEAIRSVKHLHKFIISYIENVFLLRLVSFYLKGKRVRGHVQRRGEAKERR